MPTPKQVRDLFQDLLGRRVDLTPADPFAPGEGERATLAVYVDDQMRTRAVAVADLALSVYVAAAIELIPIGGIEAALEARELSPKLRQNLHQVLDAATTLLHGKSAPHIRLHAIHAPGELPPIDVSGFARTLGRRLDLRVDVAGYGPGRFSIVGLV